MILDRVIKYMQYRERPAEVKPTRAQGAEVKPTQAQ